MRVLVVLLVIASAAVGISAKTDSNWKSRSERTKVSDDDKRTRGQGVVEIGPRTTYLQEGLSSEAVLRVLGEPSAISERSENGKTVTTYQFNRGEGRVLIADFINNRLTHSQVNEAPIRRSKLQVEVTPK